MNPPPEPPLFQIVLDAQASDEVKQHARDARTAWHILVELVLEQQHLIGHLDQATLEAAMAEVAICNAAKGGSQHLH